MARFAEIVLKFGILVCLVVGQLPVATPRALASRRCAHTQTLKALKRTLTQLYAAKGKIDKARRLCFSLAEPRLP